MTLATQFAETTRYSASNPELRRRVLHLYRKYIRNAQEFADLYELDMPISNIKTKIRQEFERQRYNNDLAVNNILLAKDKWNFKNWLTFGNNNVMS